MQDSLRSFLELLKKYHELALPLAEELCRITGLAVSMSAGIHIDRAESAEIAALSLNSREAFDALLREII